MSYYGEKSAENILKDVVISELKEFSGGEKVTSPNLMKFTRQKVFKSLIALVAAMFFSLISMSPLLFSFVLIIVTIKLVKYFSEDKLVFFIMSEAKRMPDKKISTIISEQCIHGESLPDDSFICIKRTTPHWIKPFIITLCSVIGVAVLAGSAYLFVPITLYKDVDGGCAVVYARTGLTGHTKVDAYHDGKAVVGIKSGAYKNNIFLNYIELPTNLTFIEGEAFMNCLLLKEIKIPNKVTELRGDTFHGCRSLKTVALHDDITEIHAYCFMDCNSIERIALPEKLTEIHESTFNNCNSLVMIEIPEGVTRIAARAFYNCDSLSIVVLPDSLAKIGSSAFRNCKRLEQIEIPNGCIINERAFKESPTTITYR